MFYRKNIGGKESAARVMAGLLLIGVSLTQLGSTPLGWILAASGAGMALTGLFGYCPACALMGREPPAAE